MYLQGGGEMKTNCTKCGVQFEVTMIPLHDSRQYSLKGEYPPILFCKLRSKKQFAKCQLCRNMKKALNFVNTIMEKGN